MKGPTMERNEKLAGMIVYDHGMNVIYDKDGYAVRSVNPGHPNYTGTTMSIVAQPVEDALKGEAWEKPSVVGLVDWNHGAPDMDKPIKDDADFDWSTWLN